MDVPGLMWKPTSDNFELLLPSANVRFCPRTLYIAKMPNTSDTIYTRICRAKVSKIQSRKHEVKNPVVGNCDHGYVAELFGNRDHPPVALQFSSLSRWEAVPLRSTAPRPVQNARWPAPWLPASPSSMEPRLQPDNQMSRRAATTFVILRCKSLNRITKEVEYQSLANFYFYFFYVFFWLSSRKIICGNKIGCY